MTTPINYCKCGKPAANLVIIKRYSLFLCEKHLQTLEKLLNEKLEPLTRNYYEIISENIIRDYSLDFYGIKGYEARN